MPKPGPTDRINAAIQSELSAQTPRIVAKLQQDFQGNDRTNVPMTTWHQIIQQNWQDPMWRQQQAVKIGPVQLVHDALAAFGLPKSGLANLPPPMPTTPPAAPPIDPTQPPTGAPI